MNPGIAESETIRHTRASSARGRSMASCLAWLVFYAMSLFVPAVVSAQEGSDYEPTALDEALYALSAVRDAEGCALAVEEGVAVVASGAFRNAAMSCPDMFSWLLFTEVTRERWWTAWAGERQNWPAEPFPLCSAVGTPGVDCCRPGGTNPPGHCPEFPGDSPTAFEGTPPLRIGRPSVMDHLRDGELRLDPSLLRIRVDAESPSAFVSGEECPPEVIDQLIPDEFESIGRVIRQTSAEITVRNRIFHDYLFANNLYNRDGLVAIFENNATSIPERTPYRRASRSVEPGRRADLARVDLPPDAIMMKSNWFHEDLAARLGLEEDPAHPYIKKRLATEVNYLAAGEPRECLLTGTHYLMAFHISSKDIPKWVWTTFEHVSLPGRCDITGCNDSYGFRSSDDLPPGAADNFVKPHQQSDGLNSPRPVFVRDRRYAPEEPRANLVEVLDALGIGVRESSDPVEPTPADRAWRSYRLKGSQVEYTDLEGRATVLGNSIIEGGFMDGSSCITCHSRAGIQVGDNGEPTFFGLGVFDNKLSDFGYQRSHFGVPDEDWFLSSQRPPALEVLQTDFVWGFFFARPLTTPGSEAAGGR